MKQDARDSVSRLRDCPPGGTAIEDRAAALVRGMSPCDEPSELQMAQIEEGIWARSSHGPRPSLSFRVALAVFSLLAGVASVKAYELARRAGWLDRVQGSVLPTTEPARSRPTKRPVRATGVAPVPPAAPVEPAPIAKEPLAQGSAPVLKPEPVASEPPRRQVRATRSVAIAEAPAYAPAYALAPRTERRDPFEPAPTVPAPARIPEGASPRVPLSVPVQNSATPVPSSAHAHEVHALDRAIALLRRDHDAAAALTELDAYLDRFPHGLLHREARLARLDALLMLQRTDDALAALETLSLDSGRRSTELQVVRAELRARTDCLRAEEDFDVALTHSPSAALLERILYGRGACRAKTGKTADAAEDLGRYLERFPNGAHAIWARQWLDTIGKQFVKGG
jgi:hypothetical protein